MGYRITDEELAVARRQIMAETGRQQRETDVGILRSHLEQGLHLGTIELETFKRITGRDYYAGQPGEELAALDRCPVEQWIATGKRP